MTTLNTINANETTFGQSAASSGPAAVAFANGATGVETHRAETHRVEPVDNHHPAWPVVMAAVMRAGDASTLRLDNDGWLSARQTVLAAFDAAGQVVGHLCFQVQPEHAVGRPTVSARLDALRVTDTKLKQAMLSHAESLARSRRCQSFHRRAMAS